MSKTLFYYDSSMNIRYDNRLDMASDSIKDINGMDCKDIVKREGFR